MRVGEARPEVAATWCEQQPYSYVLAVPCDEPVGIVAPDGRSRHVAVAEVEALLVAEQDWQRLSMSEGSKGPRLFDWAVVPILHQWQDDGRHWLLVRRCLSPEQQKTYYLVFAPAGTTLPQMVQAGGARWHIEEAFENGKDLGLDHYEVRSYLGWYRHIALVMLACLIVFFAAARMARNFPSMRPAFGIHSALRWMARVTCSLSITIRMDARPVGCCT